MFPSAGSVPDAPSLCYSDLIATVLCTHGLFAFCDTSQNALTLEQRFFPLSLTLLLTVLFQKPSQGDPV